MIRNEIKAAFVGGCDGPATVVVRFTFAPSHANLPGVTDLPSPGSPA